MCVAQVLGAVMALTQQKEDYASARKGLSRPADLLDLLQTCTSFPMSAVRRARTAYVAGNPEFSPEVIVKRTGNHACACLCSWVLAVVGGGAAGLQQRGTAPGVPTPQLKGKTPASHGRGTSSKRRLLN